MICPWHPSEQRLTFQLSILTLGSYRVKVLSCEFGPDADALNFSLPPDKVLEDDMIGYVMRGVPITSPRPLFENRAGYCIYTPQQYKRYFIDLQQSFDDYARGFRAKTRSTIRRKVRKFDEFSGGAADFRVYRTPVEMAEFHVVVRRVSAVTYQENILDAGLPDSAEYIEYLRRAAAGDGVRGYVLFHNDRPVSYLLLSAVQDVLVYSHLGFDPAFGKWSVGTVLHWLALESLFAEQRFRMLDFTEGEGEQKRQFGTGCVTCATIYCLRSTLGIRILLRLHSMADSASASAGVLLTRFGLRSKIRRLIRGME
jgi:CelD/BcsL family acetyltransferase involved in cellulose biosynthesis